MLGEAVYDNPEMTTDFDSVAAQEGLGNRIDELLTSALEDQAREQQLMIETVQAARSSLGAAQQEIAALRTSLEGRDKEVIGYLESHLQGLDGGQLKGIANGLSDMVSVIEKWSGLINVAITETNQKLEESHNRVSESLLESAQRTEATHVYLLEQIEGTLSEAGRRSSEDLKRLLTPILEMLPQQVEVIKKVLDEFGESNTETLQTASARTFDRIEALRSDLNKFRSAIDSLPGSVNKQLSEEVERASSARAAMSRQINEAAEAITGAIPKMERAVGRPLKEAHASTDAKLAEVRDVLSGLPAGVGEAVYEVVDGLGKQVNALSKRVRHLQLGVTESNARAEALQESLLNYLSDRDQRQEESRDRILTELIAELARGLSRRDRKRVTDSLKEAEQRRQDQRDAQRYRKAMAKGSLPPQPDTEPAQIPAVTSPEPAVPPAKGEAAVEEAPQIPEPHIPSEPIEVKIAEPSDAVDTGTERQRPLDVEASEPAKKPAKRAKKPAKKPAQSRKPSGSKRKPSAKDKS